MTSMISRFLVGMTVQGPGDLKIVECVECVESKKSTSWFSKDPMFYIVAYMASPLKSEISPDFAILGWYGSKSKTIILGWLNTQKDKICGSIVPLESH